MKLYRNITIAFFIFLTLSIGVVSTNPVAKSVYAWNNTLSQEGNSQDDQEKEQSLTSGQDNQVVSGDSSILSGNNIQCNSQINSKTTSGISDDLCAIGGLNIPDPNEDKVKIKLIIKFDVDPECVPGRATNHGCNGHGGHYMIYSGAGTNNIFRDVTVGEGQSGKTVEVSLPYNRCMGVTISASNPFLNPNGYEVVSSQIDSKPNGYDCTQRHVGLLEAISCTTFNATMDGQEKVFSFTFKIIDRF